MDKNLNNEIPENVRLKLDDTYKDILDNETISLKTGLLISDIEALRTK